MNQEPLAPYHVVASTALTPEGTHVLKAADSFALMNLFGDIHSVQRGEQGLYHGGTRYLSHWRLTLDQVRPLLLSSSVARDNRLLQVQLSNPELRQTGEHQVISYGSLHLERSKFLQDAKYFERLCVSNYGSQPVRFELRIDFAADFVDIFEVRGTARSQRGKMMSPEVEDSRVSISYLGLDERVRTTRIDFSPTPTRLSDKFAIFLIQLQPEQSSEISLWVECRAQPPNVETTMAQPQAFEVARRDAISLWDAQAASECEVWTSNEQFNEWLSRSRADLHMLITATPQGPFPYAGVPWFSTPFGRDGIWTALQTLWVNPGIARGVLRFLSAHQAKVLDPDADAEPGKILHEMRDGEMAALREIPFGKYYGSIDSTPLYLVLAAKYYESTGDRALVELIWPNLLLAVEWIAKYGDIDGDGFVEYGRTSRDGLVQQGWKDSNDSVFTSDGRIASGPIALAEVQGYVFAAYRGMADLAAVMGELALAAEWGQRAAELRDRFDRAFWSDELSTYALALDGTKNACRVSSSNAGQCLYSGIVLPERADPLAGQLLSKNMFSGWGIRTLSKAEVRYNPMSYHNGSIWPHDNAIIAAGLARYGHKEVAARVLEALFDATLFADLHRLPELFCGFSRQPGQGPTRYPVACSPQAWASGAVFMLLEAILGLQIDALGQRLVFTHAYLPAFLHEVAFRNLRIGDATVDVRLLRHKDDVGLSVTARTGKVEVIGVQ
ncbi:MAG TPA: amylo-alpha-1,6-glucosidase [Polyangiaceae bacterium]|nr:amylo-alpha-1,6-glucosidase [Polyangiaceae bacterium]